jgi:hypothetical protein
MKVIVSDTCNLEVTFKNSEEFSCDKKEAIKNINLIARESGINIKLL